MGSRSIFKKILIAIGFLALFIKSCETKSQAIITHEKLLTSAPWKCIAITACEHGNSIRLQPAGLYIFKENDRKITWDISVDGKILFIIEPEKFGGAIFPWQVEVLDANTLQLKRVAGKLTVTETYAH